MIWSLARRHISHLLALTLPSHCKKQANVTPCQCQKNANIWVLMLSIISVDLFLAILGGKECKKYILAFVKVFNGAISLIH